MKDQEQCTWVDFDEAALYLDLDRATITRFVKAGHLHVADCERIRRGRIAITELKAFVERCRIIPGTMYNNQPAERTRNPPARRVS